MKRSAFLIFLALITLLQSAATARGGTFERVFVFRQDLTADGKEEKIELVVTGADINSPFSWSLTIYQQETVLFSRIQDDAWCDRHFNDPGFYGGDYLEGKLKYYLEDLPARLSIRKSPFDQAALARPIDASGTTLRLILEQIILADLVDRHRIPKQQAATITKAVLLHLTHGGMIFNLPRSPQEGPAVYAYSPAVKGFVLVYTP